MSRFPPGTPEGDPTVSGLVHLAAGGIGFLALAAAAVVVGGWMAHRGLVRWGAFPRVSAVVVVAGFVGGAALATSTVGVLLLWIAVVVGWAWLAVASVQIYRTVPHPDADRRISTGPVDHRGVQ